MNEYLTPENPEINDDSESPTHPPNVDFTTVIIAGINNINETIKEYIKAKHSHDNAGQWMFLIIVFLILTAIVWLTLCDKMSPEISGTLLASLIGYAVGRYSQIRSGNNSE